MKPHEMTIDQLLEAIRAQQAQYAALVELACEGMNFLASVQAGDAIALERIARRDDVVRRAGRLLSDVLSSPAQVDA